MLKKLKILNKLIILSVVSRMQKQNSVMFFSCFHPKVSSFAVEYVLCKNCFMLLLFCS